MAAWPACLHVYVKMGFLPAEAIRHGVAVLQGLLPLAEPNHVLM